MKANKLIHFEMDNRHRIISTHLKANNVRHSERVGNYFIDTIRSIYVHNHIPMCCQVRYIRAFLPVCVVFVHVIVS